MKRMLFNATHAEELRVAIVDGQKLIDLDLESAIRSEKKGNIYKGKVTKVEPSLEACFVDYGSEKQGFLPLKEIYREYFDNYDSRTPITNVKIDSVIKEGQEMIVQVDKDERGTKGAALTTFVSLAGRFLVFMPNNPKGGGISRRIGGEERAELRQALSGLNVDSRHSLIARTEGIGRSEEELQWDLDFLVKIWKTIEDASKGLKAPFLIYQESNLIVRSIRDHLSDEISEIIVDDSEVYERAERFMKQVSPNSLGKLKLYSDSVPLFSRYQIEGQISSAFQREVDLPSGGSIAIDHTEALISIDVNSARATKDADIEETALHTNLEAVDEVARQLRVRDLGGLVVIDLIDMMVTKNQRAVETRLKDALQADRARVQIGHISRFGLLEMSRQRLRSSISEANYRQCPRCDGMGTIRSVVSSSLNLLRLIEDEALKENTEAIQAVLPLDMATYLLNEKRHELNQLEARLASRIIIIPSDELSSPHFQIKRLRSEELDELTGVSSYELKVEIESKETPVTDSLKLNKPEKAQVELDKINHASPPPRAKPPSNEDAGSVNPSAHSAEKPGFLKRIVTVLTGSSEESESKSAANDDSQTETQAEIQKESRPPRRGNNQHGNAQARGRPRGGQQNKGQKRRGGQQGPRKQSAKAPRDGRPQNDSKPQQEAAKTQEKSTAPKRPTNGRGRPASKKSGPRSKAGPQKKDGYLSPTQTNDMIRKQQSDQGNRSDRPANSRKSSGGSLQYKPHSMAASSSRAEPAKDLPDDIGNRK